MNDDPDPAGGIPEPGASTNPTGTPMPVDLGADGATRRALAMFVMGPVAWFGHFMVVYLVAEAGCTGDGPGLQPFDAPVPALTTLVVTLAAATVCLWVVRWHHRRWRDGRGLGASEHGGPATVESGAGAPLAFAGMLLGWISLVSVLLVGAPALVFTGC